MSSFGSAVRRVVLVVVAGLLFSNGAATAGEGFWDTNGPFGGSIWRVEHDSAIEGLCYAAGENGFFRSEDGGATWRWSVPKATVDSAYCTSFCASPAVGGLVFANIRLGDEYSLFRSEDGAQTWEALSVPWGETVELSVACDPSDPGHVCAAIDLGSEIGGRAYRSYDRGARWDRIYSGASLESISIDPADPDVIWILRIDEGPMRTTNGGDTWEDASDGVDLGAVSSIGSLHISPFSSDGVFLCATDLYRWAPGLHTWQSCGVEAQDVAFCQTEPWWVFASNYGEYHFSDNGGDSWHSFEPGAESRSIDVSPLDPLELLAASGDGVLRTSDGCRTFETASDGITAQDGLQLLKCGGGEVFLFSGEQSLARSTDSCISWSFDELFDYEQHPIFGQAPSDPNVLYVTFEAGFAGQLPGPKLLTSTNGGEEWELFSILPPLVRVQHISVDPSSASTVYLGVSDNAILRTTDGGESWEELTVFDAVTPYDRTGLVAVAPYDPNLLYVCTSDGLYLSGNGGFSFIKVRSLPMEPYFVRFDPIDPAVMYAGGAEQPFYSGPGLHKLTGEPPEWRALDTPIEAVYDLAINPSDPDELYIAGYSGVHRSRDGGEHWMSLWSAGLGCRTVKSLVVDFGENGNMIRAAGSAVFSHFDPLRPFIMLSTSQMQYAPGDTFELWCDFENPVGPMPADLGVAVMVPGGSLVFLPTISMDFAPFYSGLAVPGDCSLWDFLLFETNVVDGLPVGEYSAFAALLEPGTLSFTSNLAVAEFTITASK